MSHLHIYRLSSSPSSIDRPVIMGDQPSTSTSPSSSFSPSIPFSIGRALGRMAPSFGKVMSRGVSLPSLSHPSIPPSLPLFTEILSSVSNHHLMDYSNDTAIAHMDETHSEVELEARKRKRRSRIISPEEIFDLWDRGEGEEGDILPTESSLIANLCEVMVGERSSGDLIRALKEQKREGAAALIEIMTRGGNQPVKITEWADEADIDDYYLLTFAQEACEQLPPGIVKMKAGYFEMGEALSKYASFFKTIYAQEMMVILDEEERMKEKEIATNLGVASLEAFLAMKSIKDAFYVEKKDGELFVSKWA